MRDSIRLLHVEEDLHFAGLTARHLERGEGPFAVETADSATQGLHRLTDAEFDCIVSEYTLPGMNGIEFLETVREDHPDLPFILFTGAGNEDVAATLVSRDATDYLQKGTGKGQFDLLSKRARDLVKRTHVQRDQRRMLKAIETAQVGISILDEECHFSHVNNAYADLYGYDPEELIGQHWALTFRDEDIDEIENTILPAVESTGFWNGETVGLRADGSTFVEDHALALADGSGFLCTVTDISEPDERTRELQRHKAFVEHSPTLVTLLDEEGTVVYDNTGIDLDWRHAPDDFFGENVFEYIHPDDRERVSKVFETVFKRPDDPQTVEFRFRGTDGSWYWLRSIAINLLDDPMVEGIPVTTIDITERKQHEKELQRQNERLEEVVGIISHDLRNPLNIAEGRLGQAREECENDYLDHVARAHDRMEALIDDLLKLARSGMQVDEVEPVEMASTIETCWQNVETAEATISIDVDQAIQANRSRLQQLIENLIRNAVEHGGRDVAVTVGELDDGFYVEDSGPGIPSGEYDDVFNVGFSTAEDGTGFGLSIVEQIVDAHDWDIQVTERTKGGARFEITDVEFVR